MIKRKGFTDEDETFFTTDYHCRLCEETAIRI